MPILLAFWVDTNCDCMERHVFLGSCEYLKRKELEIRIEAWKKAFNREHVTIHWVHSYLNSLKE